MTDATMEPRQDVLLAGPGATARPEAAQIARVFSEHGVHPLRQMREILGLRLGRQKIGSEEYYALRLYDPALSAEAKAAFVGQSGNNALNGAMNPPDLVRTRHFIANKLLYTQLLRQLGIATATTQALVSATLSAGRLPTLRTAAMIETFLREEAVFPLFGKPANGSLSVGSVRIESRDGDHLDLADGTRLTIAAFAREVMESYGAGYLLQDALEPHADMASVAGGAVGCVRVVTVNEGAGPTPVYAVWKLPGAGAMSDNFWQAGSLLALPDMATGRILSLRRGTGLSAASPERHPVSGRPVTGMTLPFWQETLALAEEAHRVFPAFGICGFDVAVTPHGPSILECNDNPSHILYQHCAGRGIRNADFQPVWDRVIARQKRQAAELEVAEKAHVKKRKTAR